MKTKRSVKLYSAQFEEISWKESRSGFDGGQCTCFLNPEQLSKDCECPPQQSKFSCIFRWEELLGKQWLATGVRPEHRVRLTFRSGSTLTWNWILSVPLEKKLHASLWCWCHLPFPPPPHDNFLDNFMPFLGNFFHGDFASLLCPQSHEIPPQTILHFRKQVLAKVLDLPSWILALIKFSFPQWQC